MQAWILTFNRPLALNRQIYTFSSMGYDVYIYSNHPKVQIATDNKDCVKQVIFNHIANENATSYCARSWNSIFINCFKTESEGIFVQDDTPISTNFKDTLLEATKKFDLIWGPAGDVFFYLKKAILKQVGWFDERYLGCYCGDADFLKRIWQGYDKNKLCIEETHDWGFIHNPIGLQNYIKNDLPSKGIDSTYNNQHHELENLSNINHVLQHSQNHFKTKWGTPGNGINGIGSMINYTNSPLITEIDWYPWFTKKYL